MKVVRCSTYDGAMNCTKSYMVSLLRRLGAEASMPLHWDIGLTAGISDWDLYDMAKAVALALVACDRLDPTLSAYIKVCREHGAGAVSFVREG